MKVLFLCATLLLLTSSSFAASHKVNSQCQQDLLGFVFNSSSLGSFIKTYMNTGWSPNELGNMDACNAVVGKKYVHIAFDPYHAFNMGFCGPDSCDLSDYETLSPTLALIVTPVTGMPVTANMITYAHPRTSADTDGISTAGWMMFSGLIVLAVLCFAGGVSEYLLIRSFKKQAKFHFTTFFMAMKTHEAMSQEGIDVDSPATTVDEEWAKIEGNLTSEYMLEVSKVYKTVGSGQRFLLQFSVLSNAYSLTSRRGDDKALDVLNGVRVLSIFWVLAGHCFSSMTYGSVVNLGHEKTLIQNFPFVTILNGGFAVDSFFFLSGLLAAFVLTSKMARMSSGQSAKSLPFVYLHRFLRLTPLMFFVIIISWKLVPYFGTGPNWRGPEADIIGNPACDQYWWTNLVYINNLYPQDNPSSCLPQLWYTANDMQFFMITPIILMVYLFVHKAAGLLLVAGLCIASWVHIWVMTYKDDLQPFIDQPSSQNYDYYISPFCRVPAYLVGTLFGLAYYEYKKNKKFTSAVEKLNKSRAIRWVFYLVGLFLINFMIYIIWPTIDHMESWDKPTSAAYMAFSRCGFVLGLGLFLLPVVLGNAKPVRAVLSNFLMTPLSRLTYGIYLTHVTILMWFWATLQVGVTTTYFNNFYLFFGLAFTSIVVSAIMYVLVEMPFFRMEKAYLMPAQKKRIA